MPPEAEHVATNFTRGDWVVVALYPLISLGIGLYVRRLIRSMKSFVAAGQSMGLWLGIATMTGTELGLITFMYSAEKGFKGGFAAFHIALAAGISTFLVGFTGFIVFRLRELEVLTIPEFYGKRFDRKTQLLGGTLMALGGILNMGLFLKVSAQFITGVSGLSDSSWVTSAIMIFLSVLVLLYTSLGGMVSVVISDYIQFVVLSVGMLVATACLAAKLGWQNIVETIQREMGIKGFDPITSEGEFGWQYMVWMLFLGLVSCGIWPTAVARALAADSPRTVRRQYMISSVSFLIRFLIPYFWGICAFVYISQDEGLKALFFPPDASMPALQSTLAMPIVIGKILPAGLLGIVTAGMLAAFMSTQDSYLLCWSSVLTQDVIAPAAEYWGKPLSNRSRLRLSRFFILAISIYVLYWGVIYHGKDDIWDYMAVTGAIYFTGAFACLLGGLYWTQASSTGAFLALLSGASAICGLGPIRNRLAVVLDLEPSSLTSAGVGLGTILFSLVVLVVGSLLFPDKDKEGVRTVLALGRTNYRSATIILPLSLALGLAFYLLSWEMLWTVLLVIGVALFALMAVVVGIGAAFDVKKLLRTLAQQGADEAEY